MSALQTIRRSVALLALVVLGAGGVSLQAQATIGPGSSASNPYGVTAPGVVQQPQQQTGASGMTYSTMNPGAANQMGNQLGVMQPMNQQAGAMPMAGLALYPDPKQYVLGAGDLISVHLYGINDYYSTDRISSDNTMLLPLIGSVTVGNLTIRQAEELIATRLREAGMYKNPEVLITVGESVSPQSITLVGEMHGIYPVQGRRNLLDVLAASGGLPPGSGRTLSIIRPGVEEPILVDLGTTPQEMAKANVPVFPRDTIFVPRAGFVYIVGAFRTPGAFPLQPGRTTLMQLASLAGGPMYQAKYDDMRIVRTTGTTRTEVKVDIKKVLYGKAPDPEMMAGDIIFLPTSQFKAALSNGGISTLLGAISVIVLATVRN